MKINRLALLFAPIVLLRACVGAPPEVSSTPQTVQRPRPVPAQTVATPSQSLQPAPARPSVPQPRTSAESSRAVSWRDAAQTPGSWTYRADPGGSAARFGLPGAAPLLVMRCDKGRPAVVIERESFGTGTLPAAITTSSAARQLSAVPLQAGAQNAAMLFEIAFNPADPLLDSMAFSRGRFMVEMSGAATLSLPAWAEIGRLIEDCR
jgi:hypothetical protein